jgi:hypothetical protein
MEEQTDTEMWREYKVDQRKRRAERLGPRVKQIMELKLDGYQVEQLTPYQYRINNEVDVYPVHNRYCLLRYRRWGNYRDVKELIKRIIKPKTWN